MGLLSACNNPDSCKGRMVIWGWRMNLGLPSSKEGKMPLVVVTGSTVLLHYSTSDSYQPALAFRPHPVQKNTSTTTGLSSR